MGYSTTSGGIPWLIHWPKCAARTLASCVYQRVTKSGFKYFFNYHPENCRRWSHFDYSNIFQMSWNLNHQPVLLAWHQGHRCRVPNPYRFPKVGHGSSYQIKVRMRESMSERCLYLMWIDVPSWKYITIWYLEIHALPILIRVVNR